MRFHMILNMPAVLSIHKDWKAREREGGKEEECGGRNLQEIGTPWGPILAACVPASCLLRDNATLHIVIIWARRSPSVPRPGTKGMLQKEVAAKTIFTRQEKFSHQSDRARFSPPSLRILHFNKF